MRHSLLLASLLCGVLAGCQTGNDPWTLTKEPPELSDPAASAIAGDLSGRFAEQAGSLSKTVTLQHANTAFGTALRAALKGWGYTIADDDTARADKDNPPSSPQLRFALVDLDGQVLARLSTDKLAVSRVYSVTPTGATPASPLSLMTRN